MTRSAVVVGVGDGTGTATFERLSESGVATAICSNQPERTESVARTLRDSGHVARTIHCDPKSPVDLAQGFADALEAFETIDMVVFVAGATPGGGLLELGRREFIESLERDVLGGFCTARAVVPRMQAAGGGTLVFIGGSRSLASTGDAVGPSSSQAGLRGLAASIRAELDGEIAVSHVEVDGEPIADDPELEEIAAEIVRIGTDDQPEAEYRITESGERVVCTDD